MGIIRRICDRNELSVRYLCLKSEGQILLERLEDDIKMYIQETAKIRVMGIVRKSLKSIEIAGNI